MKSIHAYVKKGAFYEAVVEDGSDIIFVVDFNGEIYYHNKSVREVLGYRARSLVGKNFFEYVLPSTLPQFKKQFMRSTRRAYTEQVEFQFLCRDSSYRYLEFNAINLKQKNGLAGLILDCRDITQKKEDAVEMIRLQKAKEQFLANISHEIRTPINGIAGMAGLLSQDPSSAERETYLSAIRNSAENLKVIINDILDLTAIDSGKLQFERIAFNPHELLMSLVNSFTYQAREKNLELTPVLDRRLNTIVMGDPVRLNQILINLISNAVKFTHHGFIRIEGAVSNKTKDRVLIKIVVQDTGVGIPKEKLERIFESFSQADASITRKYGGSGLGLTIARQLVELQRGRINVTSTENVGSVFTVTIPYPVARSSDAKRKSVHKTVTISHMPELRVLLVEDNDVNRLYAESILRKWQCKTDTAENGFVAIQKLKSNIYDVILMDVQMPVMDGFEATTAIRLMPDPVRNTPIVALTANATKADIEKCLRAGMNEFLPKPFTPEDLYTKLFHDLSISPPTSARPVPAVVKTQPDNKAYDLSYLRTTAKNDDEFLREIVDTFLASTPEILSEMEACIEQNQIDRVGRLAHKVKSSLVLLGMNKLKEEARLIELQANEQQSANAVGDKAKQFIMDCRNALVSLRQDFADKV